MSYAMNETEIAGSFSGVVLNKNKIEGTWVGKLEEIKLKTQHGMKN